MKEIITWLHSDRDFKTGLQLYLMHGRSNSLKKVLQARGPSKKSIATLVYELGRIAKTKPETKPIKLAAIAPKKKKNSSIAVEKVPARYPDDVNQLVQKRIRLFSVAQALHFTLEKVDPDKRRRDAMEILSIWDQIQALHLRIDYWERYKVLPPDPIEKKKKAISDLDRAQLLERQMNLRTYVSRYKRLAQSARTAETRFKHQHLLDEYKIELDDITKKLNDI
jgi:hypothetical protein